MKSRSHFPWKLARTQPYIHNNKLEILCHRPRGLSGLDVSLQLKGFGQFEDAQEAPPEYYAAAIESMIAMAGFITNENDHRKEFVRIFSKLAFHQSMTFASS